MPFIIFFSLLASLLTLSTYLQQAGTAAAAARASVPLPLCRLCCSWGQGCVSPLLPQAPDKKLGEGRWAVNDLSLGMGITQVVTGRG